LGPFRFLLVAVAGWMNQQPQYAIEYLREEMMKNLRVPILPGAAGRGYWEMGRSLAL
jgi:hypothetical protein